jgi:putative transcriptional regulator
LAGILANPRNYTQITNFLSRGVIMAIKVHLEEVLKDRQMTSKELSSLIGITEANLSILRSGKAKGVRFNTLNKICYYLQCHVEDIIKFDGELEDNVDE